MRDQIVEKLETFLSERPRIKHEFEVIYLMVELRKLLDREKEHNTSKTYPLVRFHADWALHTRKERITPTIREIMNNIGNSIDVHPKDGNIEFLLLPEFRKELSSLLDRNNLPNKFCKNDDEWMDFMIALSHVLADQPIVNPTDIIAEFSYIDVKKEGIMANIEFRGSRKGHSITLGFGL